MLPWIVSGVLFVLLVFSVRISIHWMSRFDSEARDCDDIMWKHQYLEETHFDVVTAFCRSDFRERRLLVKVDAYEDEDQPDSWVAEAVAAPYGALGPFWKFGATSFVREGRLVVRVWIDAEPGGRHVSIVKDIESALDDRYGRGLRFIELVRRKHDRFKAYPHEESVGFIKTFFGEDGPYVSTSCFHDPHVRTSESSSAPESGA